jgi:hypothetical protein
VERAKRREGEASATQWLYSVATSWQKARCVRSARVISSPPRTGPGSLPALGRGRSNDTLLQLILALVVVGLLFPSLLYLGFGGVGWGFS